MKYGAQQRGARRGQPERLQVAADVVVLAGDEVRLQLRMQLEVRMAQAVHAEDPPVVVEVKHLESPDGGDTDEEHHRKHEDRDCYERRAEVVHLRDERKSDHRARQHPEEHAHPSERLLVGERPRGDQAPVLRREDLDLFRHAGVARRKLSHEADNLAAR